MRYLTKSRFKLALECVTKLYYTKKPREYADQSLEDPFLKALAEGGFQVGELAKFLFCDDPIAEGITVTSLDYDEALQETEDRLKRDGKQVIAEAAFSSESLFVRVDLVVKKGKTLNLYEVKSKSKDSEPVDFFARRGTPRIASEWVEYLYDIAFQKYVVSQSLKGLNLTIAAHLILVDKSKTATVDGLNQKFKILKQTDKRVKIEVEKGLTPQKLGAPILKVQNVDEEIQRIWDELLVPTDIGESMSFRGFVEFCSSHYSQDKRKYAPLGRKCKDCQFVNSSLEETSLKSGFHECWKHQTKYADELLKKDLVLTLWCGGLGSRGLVDELIASGKYLIEDVRESDIAPKGKQKEQAGHGGLSSHNRRIEQINRIRAGDSRSYFDREGLLEDMDSWVYPLHMIDFETTTTALPFHKGRHPYEGIAFQFSHHVIEKDGRIRHAGQYISFEPGVFPNYHFVRELKTQLEKDNGSVFRYHYHENTCLRKIYDQLRADLKPEADKEELISFIRELTILSNDSGEKETGQRCMIDLHQLVLRYYYAPHAKGSNSLKAILPAVIHDSEFLRSKYSKPCYGKAKEVKSLNFDEKVWIAPEFNNDPYRTLGPLFKEYDTEELDRLLGGFDEIAEGGAAMTAYNYLQFSEIPNDQRIILRDGLLRYCELDTMAMVMLIEGWMNMA